MNYMTPLGALIKDQSNGQLSPCLTSNLVRKKGSIENGKTLVVSPSDRVNFRYGLVDIGVAGRQ